MKIKTISIGLLFLLLSMASLTFAQGNSGDNGNDSQGIKAGTIISIIPIGQQNYCIVHQDGKEKYFKSSVFNTTDIQVNQPVTIDFKARTDGMVQIIVPNVCEIILASKIQNSNNGISPGLEYRLPKQEGEILFFESEAHLAEVYDLVQIYISKPRKGEKSAVVLLQELEQKFEGYTSFRKAFETKYDLVNGDFTDAQVTKIENEDFINDEILKTFLNSSKQIGIGNSIYYYHQRGLMISFTKDNPNKDNYINVLKEISVTQNNKEGYDIYNPNSPIVINRDFEIHDDIRKQIGWEKDVVIASPEYVYQSIVTTRDLVEDCNGSKKGMYVSVYEQITYEPCATCPPQTDYHYYYLQNSSATLTVYWGDGTSDVYTNYNGQEIFHSYATENTFNPTTNLTFYGAVGPLLSLVDGNGTAGNQFQFEVNGSCSSADKQVYGEQASGGRKMTCKLWINHNILGHHIGSYTHSWKQKSNGNWQRKIAHIYTNVDGQFRNNSCGTAEHKYESDSEHQERVEVVKTKIWSKYRIFGNGDVKSHHTLSKDGINLVMDLVINPC